MRIMTTNIWGDYFGNPVLPRQADLHRVYQTYSPDVIGFQEVTKSWYQSDLFPGLSQDYFFVGTEICENKNFVPLAVKNDYELLAKGYERFSDTPDASKAVTWAVVRKEEQQTVAVCNTHFWWKTGVEHDRLRVKNAQQLCEVMRELLSRFHCPVFAFGDLNCKRSSSVFSDVFRKYNVFSLFDMAAEKDDVCSLHGDPEIQQDGTCIGKMTDRTQEDSIDHIIAIGSGFGVSQYRVVTEQFALDATDHSPVFADVTWTNRKEPTLQQYLKEKYQID